MTNSGDRDGEQKGAGGGLESCLEGRCIGLQEAVGSGAVPGLTRDSGLSCGTDRDASEEARGCEKSEGVYECRGGKFSLGMLSVACL